MATKDFRARTVRNPSPDELAAAAQPAEERGGDVVREIKPFALEKTAFFHPRGKNMDLRPVDRPEEVDPDPKDSFALASAPLSLFETGPEIDSSPLQRQLAAAAKASTQLRENEPSTPPSSLETKTG